jgi:hypothetical protein
VSLLGAVASALKTETILVPHKLEDAWRAFQPKGPPFLLSGDEFLLRQNVDAVQFSTLAEYTASTAFANPLDTSLHLGLIPIPFIGPLRSARVFILMLNPGLCPEDYFAEIEWKPYREALMANLQAASDFFCLNPAFAWHSGFRYWHGKLRQIVAGLASAWNVPYLTALSRVAQQMAVLQLMPYHSLRFGLSDGILRSLESVRLMRSYVHEVLVPQAQRGEALIVVTRKSRHWGLPNDEHILVYDRQEAVGAHLTVGSRGGNRILEYLRGKNEEVTRLTQD